MRIRTVCIRARLAAACLALVLFGAAPGAEAQRVQSNGNACSATAKPNAAQHIGSSTCLPIPRFVSLRAEFESMKAQRDEFLAILASGAQPVPRAIGTEAG